MDGRDATKAERFAEFLRRLDAAPAAGGFDEAYRLIGETLNAVEDEMTDIPFDPSAWVTDGRMYPPQDDRMRSVPNRPDVKRFVSKRHSTWIGNNGAIEIRDHLQRPIFRKAGADGKEI